MEELERGFLRVVSLLHHRGVVDTLREHLGYLLIANSHTRQQFPAQIRPTLVGLDFTET